MANHKKSFSPIELLAMVGLVLGLGYGLATWFVGREQCQDAPGSLTIRTDGGEQAFLYGLMTGQAECKLRRLAKSQPGVTELVLVDVPGTIDLIDTQAATRFVRSQGWSTLVPSNGSIASGGVMLFLGGKDRRIAQGGQVGVHAWSQSHGGRLYSSPEDIPAGSERAFRTIYSSLGIDPAFYDFQVEAATADDIHWMTRSEMSRWKMETF